MIMLQCYIPKHYNMTNTVVEHKDTAIAMIYTCARAHGAHARTVTHTALYSCP